MIYAVVTFTVILREIFEAFYQSSSRKPRHTLTLAAQKFDEQLTAWKDSLSPFLSFEQNAPIQSWAIDQKMTLKLRESSPLLCLFKDNFARYDLTGYYNAQTLLYRPFLPLVKQSDPENAYHRYYEACIDAARRTLELLHVSFTHRPCEISICPIKKSSRPYISPNNTVGIT